MRYIFIVFIVVCVNCLHVFGQNNSGNSGISLNVIVPDLREDFNNNDETMLETRLQQITTNYGIGGATFNPNFVMVPNVIIDNFETIGGAPPKTLARLNVILKIANADTKTIFSTASITTSGVGNNKNEALSEAIKKLDTRNKDLKSLINDAKSEIIEYYNQQCDNIMKKVEANASAQKFELAFSYLYRIPSQASCYDTAMSKVGEIFKQYQKVKCSKLVSAAEAAYGAGNMELAAKKLALIPASSKCSKKVEDIADEMKDERIMKYKTEAKIRKLRVQSARDIAMAFAKNRPDKVVDIRFLTGN